MTAISSFIHSLGGLKVTNPSDPFSLPVPFEIQKVVEQAQSIPKHSWEYGTAIEALLELYNPELSVFGESPFSHHNIITAEIPALTYAEHSITLGSGKLSDGVGSVGDPASMGVGAYLLGRNSEMYKEAASEQLNYVVDVAPRWENGAISHRANVPELWADFMYMAPPFIAYVGADTKNNTLLEEGYTQCKAYRDVLSSRHDGSNLWKHIVGPESADPGHWSSGNGWASSGMTRVLATIMKAPSANNEFRRTATRDLTQWIKEIVDAVMERRTDHGLVRNYVDDTSSPRGFGEFAGMSMIASVIYRMIVLVPSQFGDDRYVEWANNVLLTLGGKDRHGTSYINDEGIISPAVNPYAWHDTTPYTIGSPEAQAMVTLAYAAFRDCVKARKCSNVLSWESTSEKRNHRAISSHHRRRIAHNA